MGMFVHDAIVVTGQDEEVELAACKAEDLGLEVLGPSEGAYNGFRSFMVCPDGSKHGRETSNFFDGKRAEFVEFLKKLRWLSWVSVSYGEVKAKVDDASWGADE